MVLQKSQNFNVMKKRIEKYIPDAIRLIKDVKIADEEGNVNNEFNGYFSSFGAAIVQSGLRPALAFFSNIKKGKTEDRAKIMVAIYLLVVPMKAQEALQQKITLLQKKEDQEKERILALLNYVLNHEAEEKLLKAKIIDASIALKLAVRTYNLKKDGDL